MSELKNTGIISSSEIIENGFLSSGYTSLEYLTTSGTQCINTGLTFSTESSPLMTYFKVAPDSSSGLNSCFAGCGNTTWNGPSMLNFCSNRMEFGSNGYTAAGSYTPGTIYKYYTDFNSSYQKSWQDDTLFLNANKGFSGSTGSLFLFCFGTSGSAVSNTYYYGKFYEMSIADSSGTRAYFVPVKRNSDSIIGVYNLINNTFHTNAGSEAFTAGPELGHNNVKIKTSSIATPEFIEY